MNGINKYFTETSEEISIERVQLDIGTGRLAAKAEPRPKLLVSFFFFRERKWIDINPEKFREDCFFSVKNS